MPKRHSKTSFLCSLDPHHLEYPPYCALDLGEREHEHCHCRYWYGDLPEVQIGIIRYSWKNSEVHAKDTR